MPALHGTYDASGQFHPQTVRPARTMSGQPGLFSGGCLAHPLSEAEFTAFMSWPQREQAAYCLARGFTLEAIDRT